MRVIRNISFENLKERYELRIIRKISIEENFIYSTLKYFRNKNI